MKTIQESLGLTQKTRSNKIFFGWWTVLGAGIGKLEGGVQAPVTGWLVDKFGPKWVIFFSVFVVVGIGLVLVY